MKKTQDRQRCAWCSDDPLYVRYHDDEWGVAVHDDRQLFEMLCLEGQQAGLSWITVLKKREHYRKRFYGFVPAKVAAMSDVELEDILLDTGVVRNRLKIYGIRKNAQANLQHFSKRGSFSAFVWSQVGDEVLDRRGLPFIATSPESDALSKALKKKGYTFVGSTICYAFMQACGLVNDHAQQCWKA